MLFGAGRFDLGEQIIVVTGGQCHSFKIGFSAEEDIFTGSSGIGELIANTLAVRNVAVVVLDVNPIVTENCESSQPLYSTGLRSI